MSKRKTRKTSKAESLLVELLVEELPPKALQRIGEAFASGIASGLAARGLVVNGAARTVYATPRRLAAKIAGVSERAPDRAETKKLMPTKVAYDTDGKVTQALLKRLEREGFPPGTFGKPIRERLSEHEGYVLLTQTIPGPTLAEGLQTALNEAIAKLPTPKLMSYQLADGVTTQQFVRPAHRLLVIHGRKVVGVSVLGLKSGNSTCGHRFLSKGNLTVPHAEQYEQVLQNKGHVIASFEKRKQRIRADLKKQAGSSKVLFDEALLDEVAALVEFPTVYAGKFHSEFLDVPQECLILSMQQHQRYFPLADANDKLLPRFLMVSNIRATDPENIVHGNERVLRARLADAKFFYDQDRKERLEERVPRLANVVYHNQLGSQLERVERLIAFAEWIAEETKLSSIDHVRRAAYLSKADLTTDMVGEFPELQGVMGRYYALNDQEPGEVPNAIQEHYYPRFASDHLPSTPSGISLALADKIFSLAALARAGERASGEKDPFGFRRTAIGITRILVEKEVRLDLCSAIEFASKLLERSEFSKSTEEHLKQQWEQRTARERGLKVFGFGPATHPYDPNVAEYVFMFLVDRLRFYLKERGWKHDFVEAVLSLLPKQFHEVLPRLEAVKVFSSLPEAEGLATANKRIHNILHKSAPPTADLFSEAKLTEPAERALYDAFNKVDAIVESHLASERFTDALKALAALKAPVDEFFDRVMVNVENTDLRNNRLILLMQLNSAMNQVADISKLAA